MTAPLHRGRSCEWCSAGEHDRCDGCGAPTVERVCPSCGYLTCEIECMHVGDAAERRGEDREAAIRPGAGQRGCLAEHVAPKVIGGGPRVYVAVSQPADGGVPVTAISTVHRDDYDELEAAFARRAQALEDLLEEIAEHRATVAPGPTGHPYNLSDEHRVWAVWGRWRAGGEDIEAARSALIHAMRADLLDEEEADGAS